MYQLRSQIDLFNPYKFNTGVLTGAQVYLKGTKRVPEAFFGGLHQIRGRKKIFLKILHSF